MRAWCTILFCSVMLGCVDNAPRDNPLDPLSPKYTGRGGLTGRTIVAGLATATGIEGVTVVHIESGTFVMTDSMGYFVFNNLPLGMQYFACAKQNFTNDTFQVEIQSHGPANVIRGLNGAPVVLSQKILTGKIDYVLYSPKYYVDIVADVTDPNGILDLNSVWFKAGDSLFLMEPKSGKFYVTLVKSNFPTNTIQWLTNQKLYIVSTDNSSATNISEPFSISRIIENTSTPLSPGTFENVNLDTLVFKWKPPDVTFNYTSTITVYNAGTENVALTYPGVISFYEQYPSDGSAVPLQPGNYFWTVTTVDDFGNYSRSKESYFTVPVQ